MDPSPDPYTCGYVESGHGSYFFGADEFRPDLDQRKNYGSRSRVSRIRFISGPLPSLHINKSTVGLGNIAHID